jgi:hypothetical protein
MNTNNNTTISNVPLSFNTAAPATEPNKAFQLSAFSLNAPSIFNFTSSATPCVGFVFS